MVLKIITLFIISLDFEGETWAGHDLDTIHQYIKHTHRDRLFSQTDVDTFTRWFTTTHTNIVRYVKCHSNTHRDTKNTELVQRMMGTLWQTAGHLASSSPRQHPTPLLQCLGGFPRWRAVSASAAQICQSGLWPSHLIGHCMLLWKLRRKEAWKGGRRRRAECVCVNVCVLVFPGRPCPRGTPDADVYKNPKTGEVWKMHDRD